MAEKTPPTDPSGSPGAPAERIEDLQIERELQDSYLTYAMSTIMDRALPDVRDGLKPSQRRVVVSMNDLRLGPRSKHYKCAKIVGDTTGNYHPHGNQVVYPTLVRLGQPWNLRYPLVDPQGNFGSTDGDPPAAERYTEARMTSVAMEMLQDLELDTVDFQPNYDDRLQEPTVLPGKFPNLLVNGSTGIAVGMACNLAPHSLREICDAIVKVIDNPDCTLAELLELVPGPDFPTGGIICGRDGIIDAYRSGRGRLTLRAKIEVEEVKGGRPIIVISEIPYAVIRKNIVESIAACAKNDQIRDISDVNDHSGREHACRIVVDLKRDADTNVIINQIFQFTPCQITVSMINIALVNRQPRTMGLKELIQHFIEHRRDVITRRTKFQLRKAQQEQHILEGLVYAVCDIDEVVRLIRSSKTRDEAIAKLRERAFRIVVKSPEDRVATLVPRDYQSYADGVYAGEPGQEKALRLTQAQAEAIGRLQLIQLVGLELEKLVDKLKEWAVKIAEYLRILNDEGELMRIIRDDTLEIKEKYGDDRRTKIEGAATDMNYEDLIAQEDMVVTVSHEGYIKRLPVSTYRSQGRGGRGIKGTESKEGDFVEHLFVANTHDHLLFFTNRGRVYARRVYEVPQGSRTGMGRSIAQLLEFQTGEKIANVLAVKDFGKEEHFLLFGTHKGVVKKTALSAYANVRNNGIIAIGLEEGDELIGVEITSGEDQILLGTKMGMSIRFEEKDVRAMGRPAGGVTGIRFKKEGDEVVSMIVAPAGRDDTTCMVLTGCENGYGKRTALAEYRLQGRGGTGVININVSDRNGNVIGMQTVCDEDELILITQKGILIRTRVSEIRETGRAAQGVRLIKLDEGDKLVAMAKVDAEVVKAEAAADEAEAAAGAAPEGTPDAAPPAPSEDEAKPDEADSGEENAGETGLE
jgi:DNA gyrase subunit A